MSDSEDRGNDNDEGGGSVSRPDVTLQPDDPTLHPDKPTLHPDKPTPDPNEPTPDPDEPTPDPDKPERPTPLHVVLYQPEIPQNTGNIGRTCVAVGAKLWIVRPAGFRLDEKRLRRAGLDYWQHLDFEDVPNWESLTESLPEQRYYFFSKSARRTIWDTTFRPGDVFVFGRETSGLPPQLLDPNDEHALRLPITGPVRSLNLATTVGIAVYEHLRQTCGPGHLRQTCGPGHLRQTGGQGAEATRGSSDRSDSIGPKPPATR